MPENSPITKVVKKVLPAVVSIIISKYLTVYENPFGSFPFGFEEFFMVPRAKKKVKIGGGSGFIVDQKGIILTNRHVVADPKAEYVVTLTDNRKFTAEILARDPINDIAILKIKTENLPVVELGNSSKLELGQTAIAIGNALGFTNTVSVGVVSGLSRAITATTPDGRPSILRELIQTDAAINPGNSGGPLVDIEGKAIGINIATVFLAQNVGFALPINIAKKDLEDVKKYGRIKKPFLGVRYVIITKELKEKYNLPVAKGALIASEPPPSPWEEKQPAVIPGGPAQRAGLKEGDIILELEKEKISSEKPLEDALQKFAVGQTINLKILRDNKEIISKATLEERK